MTRYYHIERLDITRNLTPAEVSLWPPEKAAKHRVFVDDPMPVPSATQVVERGPIVIGPVEAHQTYVLRNKTAAELEADSLRDERAQLDNWLTDIQTQLALDNAARALLTNVQRINELEKDTRVLLRIARRYVRQEKRALL